jgi:pyruvate dehydrogenase E2 component (dihydrolipoamide acetyltransferase)
MISEVVMPQMGADMTEGTLLRWLKNEGDEVQRGEIIAEIETDKANVEIEAFESGVFRKAIAEEGGVVEVGQVIAIIAGADEDISKYESGEAPAKRAEAGAPEAPREKPVAAESERSAPTEKPPAVQARPPDDRPPEPESPERVPQPQPTTEEARPRQQEAARTNGRVRASPLARKIAEERGVDLQSVRGTGPDGRIVKKDVEQAASDAPAAARPAAPPARAPRPEAAPAGPVTMSRMRQTIARRMSQSKREAPHYYLLIDIDMTAAIDFRRQANEALPEESRISVNDLIVRACAVALQRHPMFNVTMSGEQPERQGAQNVCIAIALDDGLIAPAILDAGSKSLSQIAVESKDLVRRAKGGSLRQDEITEGTFSISNLGAYGVETLVAIIQPPQTAILGVGGVTPEPVVRDGEVVVRQMMTMALSADHRVTDGAQGAEFLAEIRRLLESPVLMVV